MTNAQKAWLDSHPEYEVVGIQGMGATGQPAPGTNNHTATGALLPDGTFARRKAEPGETLVGIRKPPPKIAGGPAGGGRA